MLRRTLYVTQTTLRYVGHVSSVTQTTRFKSVDKKKTIVFKKKINGLKNKNNCSS